MQSHPVNWPLQENGKIIRPQDLSYELPGCTGALCAGSAPENPTSSGGLTTTNPLAPAPDSGGAEPNPSMDQPTDGSTPLGPDALAVVNDDPARGINLVFMSDLSSDARSVGEASGRTCILGRTERY